MILAANDGSHLLTKVHFSQLYDRSSRSRLEAQDRKIEILDHSPLEARERKIEILDLVSKLETERKKFYISSQSLRLKGRNSRSRLEA